MNQVSGIRKDRSLYRCYQMDTSNKKVSKANVKISNHNNFNTVCFYQRAVQVILLLLVSIMMLIARRNFTSQKYIHDR